MKEEVSDPSYPGYKYNLSASFLSTRVRVPTYSLGSRGNSKTQSGLLNATSTPVNVGPDSYTPSQNGLSTCRKTERVRFTKEKRFGCQNSAWRIHETFHLYSSVGKQINSMKKTESQFSLGKGRRLENTLNQHAAKICKLSLPHAKY